MHPPLRNRLRARPAPPDATTTYQPPGTLGLDVGAVLHQLDLRDLLEKLGLRGRI